MPEALYHSFFEDLCLLAPEGFAVKRVDCCIASLQDPPDKPYQQYYTGALCLVLRVPKKVAIKLSEGSEGPL